MATNDDGSANESGAQFAALDGRRSSQSAGRSVFADAIRAVDPDAAATIEATKDWRKEYVKAVRAVVAAGARSSDDAIRIASDGLGSLHRNLVFVRDDAEVSLREAFSSVSESGLHTSVVEGTGERVPELAVPYRGELLEGDRLVERIERWEADGILEPSCRRALQLVIENPDWLDLSESHIVLLGAASEMGPLAALSSWRANILAVDLPRPGLWEHIIGVAAKGNGRLFVPTREPATEPRTIAEVAGVDLLTHAPEVRAWLTEFDHPLTIGNYVYADGATFVRLATVVDSLIANLTVTTRNDISIAYLATPTDVFAVPSEIVDEVRAGRSGSAYKSFMKAVTASRLYTPNYSETVDGEERTWGISDSLVPIQGPNYALAKSLQRWRAILARDEGTVSSANVAPSARTKSVTKNRLLAAAYRGAGSFGVEIFEPETCRVLTAALLVHDLRNGDAVADPNNPIAHPYDLFVDAAFHGGIWRLPYESRSILPLGVAKGIMKRG